MKFPASHLTLGLIAAAALTLTACGGGSDNDGNSTPMTTITPTVMDGLISHAVVCWDANNNGVCDANETQGTTDSTGKATLFIPTASLAGAKLLAVVTAGVSSDADTGVVATSYTLRATAGKHAVISPLTDMTQAKLDSDSTLTFAAAEAAVLTDLGLSGISGISVTDNFIAKRGTDSNYQNAGLKAHALTLVQQTAAQNNTPLDCTTVANQSTPNMSPVLQSINTALNDTTLQSICASGITASCETALKAKAAAIVTSCTTPVTPPPAGLTAQTISFAAPATQTMGVATPALTATSTSGLAVSFASTTPAVCTVSATTLTLVKAGLCSVSASQAGNTSYAAATTVVRTFTVLAAITPPVPVTSAANGKLIYAANSCSACHGMPPSVNKIQNGANNPTRILNAINGGTGGMNMYIGKFSTQDLSDIAAYLATPGI